MKHDVVWSTAVYLGVAGYGTPQARNRDLLRHRFYQGGRERTYRIANPDGSYPIENLLVEGEHYRLLARGDVVLAAEEHSPVARGRLVAMAPGRLRLEGADFPLAPGATARRIISRPGGARVEGARLRPGDWVRLYGSPVSWVELARRPQHSTSPVAYTPGLRTLKNLLSAALQPVGTTLYVYGGGWNWQDTGAARQTRTMGMPPDWNAFFGGQGPNYCYRRDEGPSWYPCGNYNQYYYAGADCSGYLGWVLRQVLGPGDYVSPSGGMARRLAEGWHLGTWSRPAMERADFRPGDIVSIRGHVWLCLGGCEDGSLVILHSTPSPSRTGCPGGGVQLSGLGESPACRGFALARHYMETWYPEWSRRYPAVWKPLAGYTDWTGGEDYGRFRWDLDGPGLADPDRFRTLGAEEILRSLYPQRPRA